MRAQRPGGRAPARLWVRAHETPMPPCVHVPPRRPPPSPQSSASPQAAAAWAMKSKHRPRGAKPASLAAHTRGMGVNEGANQGWKTSALVAFPPIFSGFRPGQNGSPNLPAHVAPRMNGSTPSLAVLRAVSRKMGHAALDKVPWFDKEPDSTVPAASDEDLLEGLADPEKMSRDQLFVSGVREGRG